MPTWRERFPRLSAIAQNRAERREISLELRSHLEMRIQDNIDDGMSPAEARDEAYQRFGNFLYVQQTCIEIRKPKTEAIMGAFLNDLRYGTRMLLKKPSFTLVAVLTLALGIGANTILFSIVNSVLLRPLPYADPDKLVMVWETLPKAGVTENTPAPRFFLNWREQNRSFERLSAATTLAVSITGNGEPEEAHGMRVTSDFFPMLGVVPAVGRTFLSEEDQYGGNHVAMLSYGLWQRRFAGNANIVGDSIILNGAKVTVVGVLPASFQSPFQLTSSYDDVWLPMAFSPAEQETYSHFLFVAGRLKPGTTSAQAQAEIETIRDNDPVKPEYGVNIVSLREQLVGDIRQPLLILLAATALVLLIACANVANLLLTRAVVREKEMAIRTALGAGKWTLIRQSLTESLLLAVMGCVVGALVAFWSVGFLQQIMPSNLMRVKTITLDYRVFGFTVLISLLTGVGCGLIPAFRSLTTNLSNILKDGGRNTGSGGRNFVRNLFAVAQIALSLVLLIGAGLMLKSFSRLTNVDMGFNPKNVLTVSLSLSPRKYNEPAKVSAFFDQFLERVKSIPGVESAGVTNGLPVNFLGGGSNFIIDGGTEASPNTTPIVTVRMISPDLLKAIGVQLVKGRFFTEHDRPGSDPAAIISESMARTVWPDQDPIGKRIRWQNAPWITIVGVVRDTRLHPLGRPRAMAYLPYTQAGMVPGEIAIHTTTSDPMSVAAAVRNIVKDIDKDQPIASISTMDKILYDSISSNRFNLILILIFGFVAVTLAVVGVYGVMSYTVTQNTREIGIRMALGGQRRDVLRLMIIHGLKLVVIGLAVGIIGAFALTRLMMTLLYQVSSTDPTTFVLISVLLAVVALVACYVPARRATRIDPMLALQHE